LARNPDVKFLLSNEGDDFVAAGDRQDSSHELDSLLKFVLPPLQIFNDHCVSVYFWRGLCFPPESLNLQATERRLSSDTWSREPNQSAQTEVCATRPPEYCARRMNASRALNNSNTSVAIAHSHVSSLPSGVGRHVRAKTVRSVELAVNIAGRRATMRP